jgi:hypothetical protein
MVDPLPSTQNMPVRIRLPVPKGEKMNAIEISADPTLIGASIVVVSLGFLTLAFGPVWLTALVCGLAILPVGKIIIDSRVPVVAEVCLHDGAGEIRPGRAVGAESLMICESCGADFGTV